MALYASLNHKADKMGYERVDRSNLNREQYDKDQGNYINLIFFRKIPDRPF
jgi:hypothetical protein